MAIMLSGVPIVVTQEPAESFLADNLTFATAHVTIWLNDLVVEPLVIPLRVIIEKEFGNSTPQ